MHVVLLVGMAPQAMTDARERVRAVLQADAALTPAEATDMEVGVFNWALSRAIQLRVPRVWAHPRFQILYAGKARSVLANMAPDAYVKNRRLAQRLRDGEFLPHDVAGMPAERVFPERWKDVVEMKVRRDTYLTNARPAAMTDRFTCHVCRKNECSYMELQTRSCDEPTSIFVQCLACGHRWRMG